MIRHLIGSTLSLRRKIIFECAVGGADDSPALHPVTFRYADAGDLLALNAPEYCYDKDARAFGLERLERGDRLVIGESQEGVVFYAWLMFGQMDLGYRAYRTISRDRVYTYKLFTVARCRGQRICPAYYAWLKREMRDLGFRSIVAWVEAGNHASIAAHERAGFAAVGIIWHVRFLFRSYFPFFNRTRERLLHTVGDAPSRRMTTTVTPCAS